MSYKLCKYCGQPMKPKSVKKLPDQYDHAQGCPYSRLAHKHGTLHGGTPDIGLVGLAKLLSSEAPKEGK